MGERGRQKLRRLKRSVGMFFERPGEETLNVLIEELRGLSDNSGDITTFLDDGETEVSTIHQRAQYMLACYEDIE